MGYAFAVTMKFFFIEMKCILTTEILFGAVGFMTKTIKWPQNVVKLLLDT